MLCGSLGELAPPGPGWRWRDGGRDRSQPFPPRVNFVQLSYHESDDCFFYTRCDCSAEQGGTGGVAPVGRALRASRCARGGACDHGTWESPNAHSCHSRHSRSPPAAHAARSCSAARSESSPHPTGAYGRRLYGSLRELAPPHRGIRAQALRLAQRARPTPPGHTGAGSAARSESSPHPTGAYGRRLCGSLGELAPTRTGVAALPVGRALRASRGAWGATLPDRDARPRFEGDPVGPVVR